MERLMETVGVNFFQATKDRLRLIAAIQNIYLKLLYSTQSSF